MSTTATPTTPAAPTRRWLYTKCPCGYEGCTSYKMRFNSADGCLTLEEARVTCAAEELLEALQGLIKAIDQRNKLQERLGQSPDPYLNQYVAQAHRALTFAESGGPL